MNEIRIKLDDKGVVQVQFSTQNRVTLLGMLETAKEIINQTAAKSAPRPSSNIVGATVVPSFPPGKHPL